MHFFYLPEIDIACPVLPEEESKHALKVLRMQVNDAIRITNGKGLFATALIQETGKKNCVLQIIESTTLEQPKPGIHLAIAPTKNSDRLEWVVEKATELGVGHIYLLQCDHSERKVQKTDRLEKIAIAALKQSQQCWLPAIHEVAPFKQQIGMTFSGQKLIAHCHESAKRFITECYIPGSDVLVFIGPEGDFSENEIKLALANGFQPISLGNNRLRTETAALFALSAVVVKNLE